jgi:hypothetical protein
MPVLKSQSEDCDAYGLRAVDIQVAVSGSTLPQWMYPNAEEGKCHKTSIALLLLTFLAKGKYVAAFNRVGEGLRPVSPI